MTAEQTHRLGWADTARGVAIVLVVFGHDWRGLEAKGLIAQSLFDAVDGRIYAFHMPVFFAISGLFYARTLARTPPDAFVFSRLKRLLYPLILWTYIFLGTKVLAGSLANSPVALRDFLVLPIPGILHLWFLWALLLQHLIFALSRPWLKDGVYPARTFLVIALLTLAAWVVPLSPGLQHWIGAAVRYAPYFVLGLLLGQSRLRYGVSPWLFAAATVLFAALLSLWPTFAAGLTATSVSLALALCFLLIFIGAEPALHGTAAGRLLAMLGKASLAIYVMHTIFSASLRETLVTAGISDLTVQLVAGMLAGVLGPVAVLFVARKTRTRPILGL